MPFFLGAVILFLEVAQRLLIFLCTFSIAGFESIASFMQLGAVVVLGVGVVVETVGLFGGSDCVVGLVVVCFVIFRCFIFGGFLVLVFGVVGFNPLLFGSVGVDVLLVVDLLEIAEEGIALLGHGAEGGQLAVGVDGAGGGIGFG